MICLKKKMNKFFRKSKSPCFSDKSKLDSQSVFPSVDQDSPTKAADDSSISENSHISSCNTSDESRELSSSVTTLEIPVSVSKSRSLSFDGMMKTLNQIGTKEMFLNVPTNERRSSYNDYDRDVFTSPTNSTSQSTSNLTLASAAPQNVCPKSSESQPKCLHCFYMTSLASADNVVVSSQICEAESTTSNEGRRSSGSDFSDDSSDKSSPSLDPLFLQKTTLPERSPPIFVSVSDFGTPAQSLTGGKHELEAGGEEDQRSSSSSVFRINVSPHLEYDGQLVHQCDQGSADSERASTCSNFSLSSSCDIMEQTSSNWKEAVTLQVPLFKPRSSSLDTHYTIDLQGTSAISADERRLSCEQLGVDGDPYKQYRSTSVDVNLPTEGSSDYKAILVHHSCSYESNKKAIASQHSSNYLHPRHAEFAFKKREPRSTVDWSESACNAEHIWVDTNASGDSCYLGESDCLKSGRRKKCVSCKIVAHCPCISRLDQMLFRCKPTYCEGSHRNYRENTITRHHWVHRRRQEGKCCKCGKSFQQRFSFQSKEIIAITCSWCKVAYHNKVTCFPMSCIEEKCTLGEHANCIIPPSWTIKLPRKGYFKSSVCRKKKIPLKKRDSKDDHFRSFIVKPIPSAHSRPLLVFINPKSGGNQGTKLMHKFFWLLNPRQVFDLTQTKPQVVLELYHKVNHLRILACGGDGTVGWILSAIDHLSMNPAPPVAILPLGTGNDMARTLNWGGGYTDEPVSKILNSIEESFVVQVDRWNLDVESLPGYDDNTTGCGATNSGGSGGCVGVSSVEEFSSTSVQTLPLNVMNNYFSIGADANVTLEFHESRGMYVWMNEAQKPFSKLEHPPPDFEPIGTINNSTAFPKAITLTDGASNHLQKRLVGGIDILKRSWKDLTEYISVECDGQNFDSVVRQSKFHCLLFLNIPKYAAGTNPWGNSTSGNFRPQRPDDGFLEVVGFTAASLASLQIGAHSGVRVTQCQHARLTTYKSMPVQVDGEPCRLVPSIIDIVRRNQANMLHKPKSRGSTSSTGLCSQLPDQDSSPIQVRLISMGDYESLNHDKDKLNRASIFITTIEAENNCDLSVVRKLICSKLSRFPSNVMRIPGVSSQWCFLDVMTADQYFRIPRHKEHQHYVTDVTSSDIFILDPCNPLLFHDNESPTDEELQNSSLPNVQSSSPLQEEDVRSSQVTDVEEMRIQLEKDYAGSVFLLACKSGDLNTIVTLKDLVNVSVTDTITGMTGLHYSAMHGHTSIVEYLIQQVSPVILDSVEIVRNQTALHKAASIVNRKICILLLIAGCRCTLKDNEGFLPSMLALQSNDVELSRFLKKIERQESKDLGCSELLNPDSNSEPEIEAEMNIVV